VYQCCTPDCTPSSVGLGQRQQGVAEWARGQQQRHRQKHEVS
jgi:hypothetical protein